MTRYLVIALLIVLGARCISGALLGSETDPWTFDSR